MTSTFRFDGQPVPFTTGQTVGAALVAAGFRATRTVRRSGQPRGLFCGIGVCFDCLVTVDGVPGRRACLVEAKSDMEVALQRGVERDAGVL